MSEVSTIGLDIAKSVFQVHGVDVDGTVVIRKRVSRAKVLEFFAALPSCLVGIEACPSAHHWSRQLQALGHTVRLMPPSYVKAYLKRSKNDANDAAAICEAVTRPSMRFVPTKSEQQQSGLMLHRSRQLLVRQRTMLSNAIRGHMAELGMISAKGRNGTADLLEVIANAEDVRIPVAARVSLDALARQYANITAEIKAIEKHIHAWHRSCEESRRLEEIPGIGPLVATALVAEVGENLVHRGFEVTLIEMLDQVLAPLDQEMARIVEGYLERHGIHLALRDAVTEFKQAPSGAIDVLTKSGKTYPADIVILALGVRPDTALAKSAGLEIGKRGGIRVDDQMRTSNPNIFAVGDAVEVKDFVTGEWSLIALAGSANRQGRIAADVIAGRNSRFRGSQGTSVIGLFNGAAAWTGVSEKTLNRIGDKDYEKIYLYPNSHAGYYPGAKPIAMKVIFRKSDGRLLGAQALGEDGVDKRISTLAMALQMGATIYDLEEAELCYAPQFGSAKDPVNFAGMIAADVLRDDMPLSHWDSAEKGFFLDVREPVELAVEQAPGAVNIPIGQLRARLDELPRDQKILVICRSGQRAYYATRLLLQNGFKARNLSGGMLSRTHAKTFWTS